MRVYNITTNKTSPGGNRIQTGTVGGVYHNPPKNLCQRNPLSYPEISTIPVQLSLEINVMKQEQNKSTVNTTPFYCSRLWKPRFFPLLKFGDLGSPRGICTGSMSKS